MSTFADYRKIAAINWSILKHGHRSMLRVRHAIDNPKEGDTINRMVLRANHAATLEPDYFARDFAIWTGGDRRGKEWLAFKAAHEGRQTIVKESEHAEALAIRDALRAHPEVARLLDGAQTEHAIVWTDERTGLQCKARLDVLSPLGIADIKGTGDLDEYRFAWQTADLLFYAQAAWYQEGIRATTGDLLPCFLIPYETAAPHDCAVFAIDEDWLEPGRQLCRRLLDGYAECLKSGVWPGRYRQVQTLPEPPAKVIDELSEAIDGPITY